MKINNSTVATPKAGGVVVTDEPIWSSNTGRSTTGKMIGDVIAWKTTVEVSWPPLSFSEAKTLRDAIKNAGPFFEIQYFDFSSSSMITKTVYASNIPRTLYSLSSKYQRYNNITVKFIEQ